VILLINQTLVNTFRQRLQGDGANFFVDGINKGFELAASKSTRIELIVVIVPNDNKTRYDAIKKLCCLEKPGMFVLDICIFSFLVPTQVVRSQTLRNEKNFTSVCLKVLLQINCKLGGSLWRVNIPVCVCSEFDHSIFYRLIRCQKR
jgi:aubergine-like protein